MRVLIADDDPDSAQMLAEIFRTADEISPVTDVCHDGAEALRMAMARQYDVAVLDIGMPHLSGTIAAHAIREALRDRKPLLIAVTGYDQLEESTGVWEAFDHVLRKPVDHSLLVKLSSRHGSASPDDVDPAR